MSLAAEMLVRDLKGSFDILSMTIADLSDADLFTRPVPAANHPFWQIGHLASVESFMINKYGGMPMTLPEGWHAKFKNKVTNHEDSPGFFGMGKDELIKQFDAVRQATIRFTQSLNDDDLKKPTGWEMAPSVAAVIGMNLGHTLMHIGQIQVLRRKLGKPILF